MVVFPRNLLFSNMNSSSDTAAVAAPVSFRLGVLCQSPAILIVGAAALLPFKMASWFVDWLTGCSFAMLSNSPIFCYRFDVYLAVKLC
jgi:hypothetical protein